MGKPKHGIPAALSPRVPEAQRVTVRMPKDLALAQLLHGTGGRHEKLLNSLAAAAHPAAGINGTVTIPAGKVNADLVELLRRARAEEHPAADALAAVAAQFGVVEEPGPAAAAGPAPKPAAAAPTLSGGSAK
jgi:hypothetical protein